MTDFSPKTGMTVNEIADTVEAVITEATLAEKVGIMSGKGFFADYAADGGVWGARPYRAGSGVERLGVPPLYFTDGPRGVARGNSTCRKGRHDVGQGLFCRLCRRRRCLGRTPVSSRFWC